MCSNFIDLHVAVNFLSTICWRDCLFSIVCFCLFCWRLTVGFVDLNLWALYSVPMIHMSVFVPVPCCFNYYSFVLGFPGGSVVRHSPANARNVGLIPGLGRFPEENGNPLQYSFPGKFHGQGSMMGYSPWSCKRVGYDSVTIQQRAFLYCLKSRSVCLQLCSFSSGLLWQFWVFCDSNRIICSSSLENVMSIS